MSADPRYSWAVARFSSINRHPYLATAYMALTLVESARIHPEELDGKMKGTFATDRKWRVYADPTSWDDWTVPEQATFLYHEISHLLRNHHGRLDGFAKDNFHLGNIAADCEIDDDIVAEGIKLNKWPKCPQCPCPRGMFVPADFKMKDGEMAEGYYHHLTQMQMDCPCECHKGGGQSGGFDCGSSSDGQHRPWELPDDGDGGVEGQQGVSEARGELIRHEVANKIREAAKSAGSVPQSWRLWADEVLQPKVNWRKELAVVIRRTVNEVAGQVDYTYRRLPRRDVDDIILPALRRPVPNPGFIWDTSGSMRGTESNVMAEVGGVVKAVAGGVTVICCDADVASVGKVFNPRQVQIAGGGGTDMRPAIDYAMRVRPKLDVLVIASDCYVYDGWGPAPRGMKVVVARIGGQGEPPPWPHRLIDVPVE